MPCGGHISEQGLPHRGICFVKCLGIPPLSLSSQIRCPPRHLPGLLQVTGISRYETFGVGHPVVRARFFSRDRGGPLHPCPVAFQEGNDVSLDIEIRDIKFTLGRSLKSLLRFSSALQRQVAAGQKAVPDRRVRVDTESYFGFLDGLFTFADRRIDTTRQQSMWQRRTRIGSHPQVADLLRLLQVPRNLQFVGKRNKEPLLVAGMMPQLIALVGMPRGKAELPDVSLHAPERRVSAGKVGVNLDGGTEKGPCARRTSGRGNLPAGAVGFQRL